MNPTHLLMAAAQSLAAFGVAAGPAVSTLPLAAIIQNGQEFNDPEVEGGFTAFASDQAPSLCATRDFEPLADALNGRTARFEAVGRPPRASAAADGTGCGRETPAPTAVWPHMY